MAEFDEEPIDINTPTEVISRLVDEWRAVLVDVDASLDGAFARCEYARLRMIRHYQTNGGDPNDREEAISCLTDVLPILRAGSATDAAVFASVLFLLADALGGRYDENPTREDLDLSIACTGEGLDLLAEDPGVEWLLQLANFGLRCAVRYDKYDAASDFELARDALRTAYNYLELEEEEARNVHSRLTHVCDTRYTRTLDAADLDVAVEFLAEQWDRWPNAALGLRYARRRLRRDEAGDVDVVLDVVGTVLADESLPGEQRGTADRLAASAWWQRYMGGEGARPVESMEYKAAVFHAVAVIGNPQAHPDDLSSARLTRALATIQFAEVEGRFPEDLGPVIADLEILYSTTRGDRRSMTGALLAITMAAQAAQSHHGDSIARIIALSEEILGDPGAVPNLRVNLILTLGFMLSAKVDAGMGGMADLDRAVEVFRIVIDGVPEHHPHSIAAAGGLGTMLATRAAYGYGDQAELDYAIEKLTYALAAAHQFPAFRPTVMFGFVTALMARYMKRGDLADLRRALDLLRDVRAYTQASQGRDVGVDVLYTQALIRWREATGSGSLPEIVAELEGCLKRTPPGHGYRLRVLHGLALAWQLMTLERKDQACLHQAVRYATQIVDECNSSNDFALMIILGACSAIFTAGIALSNEDALRLVVELVEERIGDLHSGSPIYPQVLAIRGMALFNIHRLSHGRKELHQAIEVLEQARKQIAPLSIPSADIAIALGMAYESAGDLRLARQMGAAATRARAWHVLTQSSAGDATAAVRQGATYAFWVARWCLRDGDTFAAWQALEVGRGLVLHAATVTATIPQLLDAVGRGDLADEWRSATQDTPFDMRAPADDWRQGTPALPSHIRQRAVSALLDEPVLFEPPPTESVIRALRSVDADALVYLVPGENDDPGLALVIDAQGRIEAIDLPALTAQWTTPAELARLGALRSLNPSDRDLSPIGETPVREGLEQMCREAWTAVMGPLLDHWRGWSTHEPRLVLVPAGTLAMVPWHAAYDVDESGRRRWAIDEAEISYIASARLLVEVTQRRQPPVGRRALVIGNPDTGDTRGDLPAAGDEAATIHLGCYPDGRFLGRPAVHAAGPGTPQDVLAWLTGDHEPHPAVLHLACHGTVQAAGPTTSFLLLANGATLSAEEILHASARRSTDVSAGLVSLAACTTHLAGRAYDEAVTLSTAFLVAGASTAIGSLWRVPDRETARLMVEFHENLVLHRLPPRSALRSAQRWLRDTTGESAGESLRSWAGFAHLGV